MVESIMFFSGGFLVASLLALVLISFVHHRAVRLTRRRLEDAIPVSLAEIQADKDKLRAEFAMTARRLEMTIEQLQAKTTSQLSDIARKAEAIAKLKIQLAEKTAVTDALDGKARNLSVRVQESEHKNALQSAAIETTEKALAAREAELARAALGINELTLTNETQKVEIALLKIQIDQFKSRIVELEREAADAARRLFDERVSVSAAAKASEEKREADATWRAMRAENDLLRERIADIAAQVAHISMNESGLPITTIIKDAASICPSSVDRVANGNDGSLRGGNLLDRIHKLQNTSSPVSTAT